jgi:hypothetical protein
MKAKNFNLPYLDISNTDMTALIEDTFFNINTVVRNLQKTNDKKNREWVKTILKKEIGEKIEVICDETNNPQSALNHNVLIACLYYKLNNVVIEKEMIFGKIKDIIQYKADLLV